MHQPLVLHLLDTKSGMIRIYECDESVIAQIKAKVHIFWDDIPYDQLQSQLHENKGEQVQTQKATTA